MPNARDATLHGPCAACLSPEYCTNGWPCSRESREERAERCGPAGYLHTDQIEHDIQELEKWCRVYIAQVPVRYRIQRLIAAYRAALGADPRKMKP